jgi:lipopolysaccharide/colanic/teichoic acid biosynthesis glycosyltransferase
VTAFRAKRITDITIVTVLLLSLVPILVLLALAVRVTSRGPILFRQERVGKGGRLFCMYKFRTMRHGSDSSVHREYARALIAGSAARNGNLYKLTGDRRVTRVGQLLRTYSLDELPQLLNILRGDMSLVGPRPSLPYEVELYGPRERLRLNVDPGLTGLWQVSGRSVLSFEQMVDLDVAYIEHWSLWLDALILLRTPLAVLTARGAS